MKKITKLLKVLLFIWLNFNIIDRISATTATRTAGEAFILVIRNRSWWWRCIRLLNGCFWCTLFRITTSTTTATVAGTIIIILVVIVIISCANLKIQDLNIQSHKN